MKKYVLLAALFCAAALATGCANNGETEKTTEAVTEAGSEAGTEAVEKAVRPAYKALDHVTLGEYKGLKVTLDSLEVTEEDIQKRLQADCNAKDKMIKATEGTVAEGDTVDIDYEGLLDGVAFEGGTAKGHLLEIGSGQFIPGFEEGLVGVKVGETVDLDITFPEQYHSAEMAGKAVVFRVTVNAIQKVPELTDELAAEISEYKTAEEYRTAVSEELKASKASEQENSMIEDLYAQVYQGSKINSYPEEVVNFDIAEMTGIYETYAAQSGQTLEEFLQANFGVTEEQFKGQISVTVQQSIAQEMLLLAIAETEGMEVTEEEFNAGVEKYVSQTGAESAETFIEQFGRAKITSTLLMDRALELVKSSAVVIDPDAATETESETAAE